MPAIEPGSEAQSRNILEDDENRSALNLYKDMGLHEAPSDPTVTRAPTFLAIAFEHLKVFEFQVPPLGTHTKSESLRNFPIYLLHFPP
jgi:hypothetical protein